jgi:hypothetical protein
MVDLPFGFYPNSSFLKLPSFNILQQVKNPPGIRSGWVLCFSKLLTSIAHPRTRAWLQQQQSRAVVLGVIVIEYFVPRPAQES